MERVFHLDRAHIQTLMYLKLSVAGHLTIFLTPTRGPFWSIRPARIRWMPVLGTQAVATPIAVYGLFMTSLGWGWAGFVWGYALVWALVNDRVKRAAYWVLDRVDKKAATRRMAAPKPDAKAETKPEVKAEPKPDATPALVERVHELYEELGREDVVAVQEWDKKSQAEKEARKDPLHQVSLRRSTPARHEGGST